eukprot:g15340.t1
MSAISGSPTLLHVDDVAQVVRFLKDAFGLEGVGSCGGEGDAEDDRFEMLENQSGSVQVVVLPKSADVLGGPEDGCATLMLATNSVRRTATTAVRAGARLLRSHRVPLSANAEAVAAGEAARVEEARGDADAVASTNSVPDAADLESGLAWLGGPPADVDVRAGNGNASSNGDGQGGYAVRVLLVDERLLGRRRSRRPGDPGLPSEKKEAAGAGGGAAGAGLSSEGGGFGAVAERDGGGGVPGDAKASGAASEGGGWKVETEAGREAGSKNSGSVGGNRAPSTSSSSSSSVSSEQTAIDKERHATSAGEASSSSGLGSAAAAAPAALDGGGAASTPPLLLSGLASLAEAFPKEVFYSCSSGLGDDGDVDGDAPSSGAWMLGDTPQAHPSDAEGRSVSVNGQLPSRPAGVASAGDVDVDVAASKAGRSLGGGAEGGRDADRGNGTWFSQEDLLGERVAGSGGDGSGGGGEGGEALPRAVGSSNGDSNSSGGPPSGPTRWSRHEHEKGLGKGVDGGSAGVEGDDDDRESTTVAASTNGSSAAELSRSTSASGATDHSGAGVLEAASGTQEEGRRCKIEEGRRPRPFRQLETFMLGNHGGPLKTSPNSITPIPINNEHFEGLALLMLKREPMDKRYAHMFKGKNRMFEVQVQGKFKKPPDGELYISLEITDRMKLGLLTRGLCKLLLSFGQKLNRRLHYSFGDKDNAELPHIAFPLVTSVDSLICTPDGGQIPVLGRSFVEDKERKASRRRGEEDKAAGIGEFRPGYTYSFSFHSMYIDMAQWSTCKIPVMRDIDLHTFWGSSALRVAAYVMKTSTTTSEAATPHLQSKLEYVFCVQVRHLSQSELGENEASEEEEDWDDGDDIANNVNAAERAPEAAALTATVALAATTESAEQKPATPPEEQGAAETREAVEDEGLGLGLATAEIGDEIALPLLTDREPSPRGRQMSASRWASNDDASDGEEGNRQARRERRRRRRRGRKAASGSAAEAIVRGAAGGGDGVGGSDGDGEARESEDDDDDDDEEEESPSSSSERSSGEVAVVASGTEQGQAADAGAAVGDDRPSGVRLIRAASGGAQTAWRENLGDATRQHQQQGRGTGNLASTIASPGREGGDGGRPVLRRGDTGVGVDREVDGGFDGQAGDAEDTMVRCPAYVDLYARSPKLQGTWTVFVVVKRGGTRRGKAGGEFALRSSKNLSILPSNVAPTKVQYSPRLSRQEVKRRKLDTVLQLLTAPSHAHANRSHQVIIRAVLGMESSADRAYRHYSPVPAPTPSTSASRDQPATSGSMPSSATGIRRGSRSDSGRHREGDGGGASSSLSPGFPGEEYDDVGTFSAGISVDRALSSSTAVVAAEGGGSCHGDGQAGEEEEEDESHPCSPRPSLPSLASNRSGGSELSMATAGTAGRRRSWASRSASLMKEGMVLRVLSEHHLSQQVAVLLPSSLTFSRPRKQCLRLLTRDILSVELGGGGGAEDGVWSSSPESQLIPGMFLVEIHTVGRVHYMLVEGIHEARSASLMKEGMVLRVLSEHHLSQQVAVLLPSSLTFSRPRKQCLRLLTRDILNVELGGGGAAEDGVWSSSPESQLIPGMFLVEIHTVGRVHYMLVEGIHEARSWASAIRDTYLHRARSDGRSSPSQDDLGISDPFSQYMTKKSAWKASNFWVLNCRRALELGGSAAGPRGWGGGCWMDEGGLGGQVCDFVASLLRQALDLNDDSKPEQLIAFLDDICSLRWMPLEGLSQSEQLAVFLNLYHVMLLHAFFILGPPGSPLRVASYFTTLCYEVGGDVLSMADLEHCVLRAKTSQPKQAGNRPESVYEQLDDASTYYVQSTSEVLVGKRTVILPKIISWYSDDFNAKAEESNGSISSSLACLLQVKRHFTGEKRRQIEELLTDGGNVSVKFESWNWKCRPVTLVSESELASLRSGGDS